MVVFAQCKCRVRSTNPGNVQSSPGRVLYRPKADLIHAVSPIDTALDFQHVTDHTESQRSGGFINIFPFLCCVLLHLHQITSKEKHPQSM